MDKKKRIVCAIVSFVFIFGIFSCFRAYGQEMGSITLCFQYRDGRAVTGIEVYLENELLGSPDNSGKIYIPSISLGHHDIRIYFNDGLPNDGIGNGFFVRNANDSNIVFVDERPKSPGNAGNSTNNNPLIENQTEYEKIIMPPKAPDSSRNTKVTVLYDASIPAETREYINKLVSDIDPAIRNFLGAPVENGTFTIKYIPTEHHGFRNDNSLLVTEKLPVIGSINDVNWDDWFTINYIHKFLQGRSIPVPGTRYTENLAHPIKTLVLNYISQQKIRKTNQKSIGYYLNAYPVFESLGPGILLNQGNTDIMDNELKPDNFLWENDSYNKMNAFVLEYAKALWFKLLNARYLESGKLDFFIEFQNAMYVNNPKTPEEFYSMMDKLIPKVDGKKCSDWLKGTSAFRGKIENKYNIKALPVNGDFFNIMGMNNPDYIYPFIILRTPGKVLDEDVTISILDSEGIEIMNRKMRAGFDSKTGMPYSLKISDYSLKSGSYTVEMIFDKDGQKFISTQSFNVTEEGKSIYNNFKMPDSISSNINTKVSVFFDSSIPQASRDYINNLIEDIDPVIRGFAGEPIQNGSFTVKYDPNFYNTMTNNMSTLNIIKLPETNGNKPDTDFDSFFFIEYYHKYHEGRTIPLEQLRYNETISQAMKIVIGNYLNTNNIRNTSVKSMDYYLNLFSVMDSLGPGVLVNNGIDANSGGIGNVRSQWDKESKYQQLMNTFTLEYSPTIWLKLADACYRKSGNYDFFAKLQNELYNNEPKTIDDFYTMIDKIADTSIEVKKASEWLKHTAQVTALPEDEVFIKALPVKGSWWYMESTDNPDYIYAFIVERKGRAKLLDPDVKIDIVDSNNKVIYTQNLKIGITDNNEYFGMKVPVTLPNGQYYAVATASYGGHQITGRQSFKVTKNPQQIVEAPQDKIIPVKLIPIITKLSASKTSIILKRWQKYNIKITALFSDGKTKDITSSIAWTSSNRKTATAKAGVITGLSKGKATLTGSYNNKQIKISTEVR